MKREIKFKAWDKKNKQMTTDFAVFADGRGAGAYDPVSSSSDEVYYDYELIQFTGLLDKNGKEIYEGDIVQIQNHNNTIYNTAKEGAPKFVVEWFEQENAWWLQEYYHDKPDSIYKGEFRLVPEYSKGHYVAYSKNFKIIGNIFENANLLK